MNPAFVSVSHAAGVCKSCVQLAAPLVRAFHKDHGVDDLRVQPGGTRKATSTQSDAAASVA